MVGSGSGRGTSQPYRPIPSRDGGIRAVITPSVARLLDPRTCPGAISWRSPARSIPIVGDAHGHCRLLTRPAPASSYFLPGAGFRRGFAGMLTAESSSAWSMRFRCCRRNSAERRSAAFFRFNSFCLACSSSDIDLRVKPIGKAKPCRDGRAASGARNNVNESSRARSPSPALP